MGPLGHQTGEPWNRGNIELRDHCVIGVSNHRIVGSWDRWVIGSQDHQVTG